MPKSAVTNEDLFVQMLEQESDTMDFTLTRKPEPGKTFSKEGLDDVFMAMRLFIGSRIAARWQKTGNAGPGPSDLRVRVEVTLDGKTFDVPADVFPWYEMVDGTRRMH